MKHLFFLMILLSSLTFAGERGGNGGDPYEIYAQNFPDQAKLNEAIELVIKKVGNSKYPDTFKSDLYGEILSLKTNEKFLYLDNVVIIPENPQDLSRFTAFGAITGKAKGDNVYFSKRSLKHPGDVFAALLLHEVLHHVVLESISDDEVFIEDLAQSIMKEEFDKKLEFGIKRGIYFRKGVINGLQVFRYYFDSVKNSAFEEATIKYIWETEKKNFLQELNLKKENNYNVLGLNTWTFSLALSRVVFSVMGWGKTGRDVGMIHWASEGLPGNLTNLYREAGLDTQWDKFPESHCKKKSGFFKGCSKENLINMNETVSF